MEFDEHEEQEDMSSIQLPSVRKLTGGSGYRYRECLKNHAVTIGGHAVDGCGEFMAADDDGTLDALMCAACNCHRNFHRKESTTSTFSHAADGSSLSRQQHQQYLLPPPPGYYHNHNRPSGYLNMTSAPTSYRPLPLALPSASREDLDEISNPSSSGGGGNGNGNGSGGGSGSSRKRFRTKFTSDQKDRMLAFAETLGWRIQKQDEGAVQQFCTETGVKRHVLKVWMHNNKHTIGKKP